MKYKVGDRVRIVSERTKSMNLSGDMDKYLGTVRTIKRTMRTRYDMVEDKGKWLWDDSMIAGLASETPFDFDAWKDENICMHCKTREEAEDFCREMSKAGLRWSSGNSYLSWSCFEPYKEQTCYCFNKGTYESTGRAENKGYQILEWSDYRSTEPKEEQEKTMETKSNDKPLSLQEATSIYKRLCESQRKKESCRECPVSSFKNHTNKVCRDFIIDNSDIAEPILKKWLAEHPVKTNEQKCNEMFLEVFGMQYATALRLPDWWQQEYIEPYKEKE